jgi:hypothetical protein
MNTFWKPDNKYVNTTQFKNVIAILFIVSDRHLT